ncbi:DUF1366 domain-containing protein [Streptococcus danieliae]|nr:DUF1366 domain-containing protein [Streptococcus danieliae]
MKLEYSSKSLDYGNDGQPSRAKVILANPEGAVYPVFLPADVINDSDAELLEKALEVVYEENFPHRAENEKFNLIGEKMAKIDAAVDKANEFISQVEVLVNKRVDDAVNELTALFLGGVEEEPEEDLEAEVEDHGSTD